MDTIKNINGRPISQTLSRSRRDGKDTWKNCIKKNPGEPNDYDDVVSHPEPDILENEVKWALGRTVINKARGFDKFQNHSKP